jgi:hypothetical protein
MNIILLEPALTAGQKANVPSSQFTKLAIYRQEAGSRHGKSIQPKSHRTHSEPGRGNPDHGEFFVFEKRENVPHLA